MRGFSFKKSGENVIVLYFFVISGQFLTHHQEESKVSNWGSSVSQKSIIAAFATF